jgi:hypothetical protein
LLGLSTSSSVFSPWNFFSFFTPQKRKKKKKGNFFY